MAFRGVFQRLNRNFMHKTNVLDGAASLGTGQCQSQKRYFFSDTPLESLRKETPAAAKMTDIGIRNIFTEEHDTFRETVRKFMRTEVGPHEEEWCKAGKVSPDVWPKLGALGILGAHTPVDDGGMGADFLTDCIIIEELQFVNSTGPGIGMHASIVMPYILDYGTKAQKEKFIPRMLSGDCIGALAMTEPSAGSDLQGIKTVAKKTGDDWILNGSKVFITNGVLCGVVIVVAITNPTAKSPAHGLSLFLVEDGMEGFKKGKGLKKVGYHGQDTAELFFEDLRLSKEHLLGEENKGFYYLMQNLPQERLVIAMVSQAASEMMFEDTREYVKQRKAFGKTLANLPTVGHKLAELKTEICVTRAFVDQCLKIHNVTKLDSESASMAKYWASDVGFRVASECLQLHGGWGYMMEYPIAKAFLDARLQPIYGGSNEVMKELVSRSITVDR